MECCPDLAATKKGEAAIAADQQTGNAAGMSDAHMFSWSDAEPVLRDDWDQFKNSLLGNLREEETLEITGLYSLEETNNTSFENLGLARANEIKALLSPPLPEDRLVLQAKTTNEKLDPSQLFAGVDFRNFRRSTAIDESIPDRTVIRFPFNSSEGLIDAEIEAYLDKVAQRVTTSGERVRLTGHTDNIGSTSANIKMGKQRAEIIKNYLLRKGVPNEKIITLSQGEDTPVATNETEAGRAQNRRTELQIIK
jgi:outer membrane protein OmpA-like peptidoglycan-associated protein